MIFNEDGLDELVNDITEEEEEDFFINVINKGDIIAGNHPSSWNTYDFTKLSSIYPENQHKWFKIQDKEKENKFEYLTFKLSSDTYIQIGHKIEVTRHNKVRRAQLYYMRERRGKSARLVEA